jgi:hypothetical protein
MWRVSELRKHKVGTNANCLMQKGKEKKDCNGK